MVDEEVELHEAVAHDPVEEKGQRPVLVDAEVLEGLGEPIRHRDNISDY